MLKATFTRQQYNGTAWVDTGDTDEKSVSFIVAAAPTALHIDTQPSEQFAVVGQTATFTVAATGDGLTYQWYINRGDGWRALPGAVNASYTTSVVTLANNGFRYYCLVSDRYGNTQEAYPAALHVEQAPDLPHTGDDAAPMLWLALCALGCAGLALLTRRKRKA